MNEGREPMTGEEINTEKDDKAIMRYFLNLFGLRGLFSLIVGEENAIDDTQCMMQMSGFGFDPSKVEREVERNNEVARMESVFSVLLLEQSLAQETRNPDHRLLASVNNHRRQLATSLETVKWQGIREERFKDNLRGFIRRKVIFEVLKNRNFDKGNMTLRKSIFTPAVNGNEVENLVEDRSKDIDCKELLLSGKANEVADTLTVKEKLQALVS
ncbi:hypothetical protein AgCh_004651 [Apium graveolens]